MLAAAMGGIDGFVFTAGIGENAPAIREAVMRRLSWLGLELDAAANAKGEPLISRKGSRVRLLRHSNRRGADDCEPHAARAARACLTATQGETSMIDLSSLALLKGKKALVTGIANDQSIAWGCAKAFHAFGADVAVTYLNDKSKPYVEPLAKEIEAPIFMPLDLQREGQLEAVFERIEKTWGKLDLCLHSIAFAPKEDLQGRVVDCSKKGFLLAMEISCWSFIRMAKLAEPLMKEGGTLYTMTYYGSQMVVEHYNIMGPVKAALESATRYLAAELGPKGIRVHAISPGPLKTRAASGITAFDELLQKAQSKAPSPQPRFDRRRRRRRRFPRHERGQADHRRDALYRRRLSHHRLTLGNCDLSSTRARVGKPAIRPSGRRRALSGTSALLSESRHSKASRSIIDHRFTW